MASNDSHEDTLEKASQVNSAQSSLAEERTCETNQVGGSQQGKKKTMENGEKWKTLEGKEVCLQERRVKQL